MFNCNYLYSIIMAIIISYIIKINYNKKLIIIDCKEKFINKCNKSCFN